MGQETSNKEKQIKKSDETARGWVIKRFQIDSGEFGK